jgi:hypothetical protein
VNEHPDNGQPQEYAPNKAEPPIQSPPEPLPAPPIPRRGDNPASGKPSKSNNISDNIMVAATIVIAIGTLVSAAAIVLQWREMVGGGVQTQQLIDAANTNAGAAKSFAASAAKINQGVGNAADKLAQQARDTETFFRTDERAWIEIGKIETAVYPPSPPFGTTFKFGIFPKNYGKTVAHDVRIHINNIDVAGSFDNRHAIRGLQDQLFHEGGPNKPGPQTIAPEEVSTVPVFAGGQEPKRYGNTFIYTFLIGRIDYRDVFNVNHWMRFCYMVTNARGELGHCTYGNDDDRNLEIPSHVGKKPN